MTAEKLRLLFEEKATVKEVGGSKISTPAGVNTSTTELGIELLHSLQQLSNDFRNDQG